ncbi:MAG: hypothetical protein ACOZNI_10410 [Myxococcota bacterium]
MKFASEFDARAFHDGPPAMFTMDVRGELRVDPERTREIGLLGPLPAEREVAHYVLVDRATGVKMYALVTHPSLAERQPRADARRCASHDEAVAEVAAQWVSRRPAGT